MTPNTQFSFSEWFLYFVAGRQLGEVISGDLEEQSRGARSIYAVAYLRSLPGLVRLGFSHITPRRAGAEFGLAAVALMLAWMWEVWVAQVYAWPIASTVYELSPLSVAATCKLAYLCLFGAGVAALLFGWGALNAATQTTWRLRTHRFIIWGLAGLVPVLYLLANPGPYDGSPVFRYIQIAIIAAIGLAAVYRYRSDFQPA